MDSKTLIIDITTHNNTGSMQTDKIFKAKNFNYVECLVMGGPVQAEEGILGGIVGASDENFKIAEPYFNFF